MSELDDAIREMEAAERKLKLARQRRIAAVGTVLIVNVLVYMVTGFVYFMPAADNGQLPHNATWALRPQWLAFQVAINLLILAIRNWPAEAA